MRLLCKVEDAFYVSRRGCVIVPTFSEGLDFRIRAKDHIELRTPDGRVLETYIVSLEFATRRESPSRMVIMLPPDIAKQDVPIGTEVWFS